MTDKTPIESTDIVIVGGGMVGSCLALALAKLSLRVSLVEPYQPVDEQAPGFDARAIALSRASAKILNSLDLWQPLKDRVTPIKDIHVSDKGRSGICRLNAEEANIPAMGYVVELQSTGQLLHQALQQAELDLHCPAKVIDIERHDQHWHVTLEHHGEAITLESAAVIAADGANSVIRSMLGISSTEKPYHQTAITSTLQAQLPHNNQAFERFTDKGPVALLPLSEDRISLVWMLPPEEAAQQVAASDAEFLAALQESFGYRLGRLTRVGQRFSYPLTLKQTQTDQSHSGVFFIGNASQSLHPIAGQGFNLGLRDVADLVDAFADKHADQRLSAEHIAELQQQYLARRSDDRDHIITLTDSLARLFANPSKLVSIPRNLMLHGMTLAPLIRHEFGRFAMGMNHPASRLTRGIKLAHRNHAH